jgi:hypothetical protein
MHWDGQAWTVVPIGISASFFDVAAISSNDVWAVGETSNGSDTVTVTAHWDGNSWTRVPSPTRSGFSTLQGVTAIASNDVWAVGYNLGFHASLALHWDGTDWELVPSSPISFGPNYQLFDVSAGASNDVWAVGRIEDTSSTDLFITHWNGSVWTEVPVTNPGNYYSQFYGVSAASANDVWAVGTYSTDSGSTYAPLFMRWNGSAWIHVVGENPPTYNLLREVEVVAPDDVWAVGLHADCALCIFADTLIMHWDGEEWVRVPSPNGHREISGLNGVAAASASDVWAVGGTSDYTTIERFSDVLIERHTCPLQPTPTGTVPTPALTATRTPTGLITQTPPPAATGTHTALISSQTPTAAPSPTSTPCMLQFSDVPEGSTFYSFVRCLACRGVLGGYGDGTFRPNNSVTRGQIAKIVSNAAGFDDIPPTQTFADVPASHTFYLFVERLSSRGVITGYPCGGPGEPCDPRSRPYFRAYADATRGQIARIVAEAAAIPDPPAGQSFEDVPPTHTFYVSIQRLSQRGVMGGYPCGGPGEPCGPQNRPYFRPQTSATRGQLSKIVSNTFFPGCIP